MFFNKKHIVESVSANFIEQRKTLIWTGLWIVGCTVWGVLNYRSIYQYYSVDLCVADLLILMQNSWNFGTVIFPFFILIFIKCKKNELSIQNVIRYENRTQVFIAQLQRSVIYTVSYVMFLLIEETVFSYLITGSWMNWNETGSLFYSRIGNLVDASFLQVVSGIGVMYFIKILIMFILVDILLWKRNYLYMVWGMLVLLIALDQVRNQGYFQYFSISFELWDFSIGNVEKYLLGFSIIVLEAWLGMKMVKKKDLI